MSVALAVYSDYTFLQEEILLTVARGQILTLYPRPSFMEDHPPVNVYGSTGVEQSFNLEMTGPIDPDLSIACFFRKIGSDQRLRKT